MEKKIPVMEVGQYAGIPVDQLPLSYLRWLVNQNFPKEITEAAMEKLKKSDYNDTNLDVTRHAIDMFSKRFLFRWIQKENIRGDAGDGVATYLAKTADEAWQKGEDVSKKRFENDNTIKLYDDILWVFKLNPQFPEYRQLVTVMENK